MITLVIFRLVRWFDAASFLTFEWSRAKDDDGPRWAYDTLVIV